MKHSIYVLGVIILMELLGFLLYFSINILLVRYHLVDVLEFTNISLSRNAMYANGIFWSIIGYFLGQYWWKMIYIDKRWPFKKNKKNQ